MAFPPPAPSSARWARLSSSFGEVFTSLDLYPTGRGEVIAVGGAAPVDVQTLQRRAAAMQKEHGFRFALPDILQSRLEKPQSQPRTVILSPTILLRPTFTT